MSESDQPASSELEEQPIPSQKKGRQPQTQQISDSETDPAHRSRSQSRRRRRKNQQQKTSKENAMPALEENQAAESQAQAGAMQPFEFIGPDETSMDGPVTYARAQRGEIPMRPGNPNQGLATGKGEKKSNDMMDQDGLKLRLDLNLDVEIELKATIKGDLTIALL